MLAISLIGCNENRLDEVPSEIQSLENLTIYKVDMYPKYILSFEREIIYAEYGGTKIGDINKISVDSLGRVFFADNRQRTIHVFDSDGNYLRNIGREGRGPGDIGSIKRLQIVGSKLYAFDHSLIRVITLNLEDLSDVKTLSLGHNRSQFPALSKSYPSIDDLYVRSDNKFIGKYIYHNQPLPAKWQNFNLFGQYYLLDTTGSILETIMEFVDAERTQFVHLNATMGISIKPFFGNTITSVGSDDRIYMVQPEYFLMKIFSPHGQYEKTFYYGLERIRLTEESAKNANVNQLYITNMHNMNLPEFWPVVTDMLIDDQDQLWVATTVENLSVYEWWVIETSGKLVARFDWPRNKPIEYIANGNIFTKETDEESGLQQIVRYKIVVD